MLRTIIPQPLVSSSGYLMFDPPTTTKLELSLLGHARVRVNGLEVNFATRKALGLLTYLALEGATTRGKLADLFWSGMDEDAARNNLRKEVFRLRETALREFLEVIAKGKAGLRLESGDFRCTMNPIEANDAFNRVAGTITNDEQVKLPGVFKGVLLESWKFDFVTDENHSVGGKIDENLTEEQVIALNREFFNGRCLASLLKTTVLFKNGRVRTTHTLKGLETLSEAKG